VHKTNFWNKLSEYWKAIW